MKKLIAIALVLAMVAPTMAGTLGFEVDSSDSKDLYNIGDVITVNVIAAFDDSAPTTSLANLTFDVIADAGSVSSGAWTVGGLTVNNGAFGTSPLIDGAQYVGNAGDFDGINGLIYSFEYTVDAATTLSFAEVAAKTPFNTAVATDLGSLDVNVVPEPMTMALMGLGGLFLRRRRA